MLTPQIESSLIKTDTLRLTRISHLEGDSVIYIGDSTLIINTAQNSIKWTSTVAVSSTSTDVIYPNGVPSQKRGLSIGNGSTIANGINSIALGLNVSTSTHAHHAVIIGSGPNVQPAIFTNNIPNSLMIGFNSNIPTLFVSSSNGINTTGNIGIATSNPIAKLHIVHQHTALRFERNGYKTYDIRQDAGNSLSFVKVDNPSPNAQNPIVLYLGDTGNVAIGNLINPQAKLHIMHNGRALRFERENANYPVYEYQQSPGNGLALVNVSNNDDIVMFYNSNSSVGIGTTSTGSFKLAVEGVIGARELKLTNENPWPDYVFAPNYNLMPIEQVAAYIESKQTFARHTECTRNKRK
ncbi:MAG: hypothetical protein KatS3mg027_2560 [Bacteroidia bacterium]|nr:MAG: hypothetical protein KatS3mg027_2560 [Bacteroidia bacterium]